MRKWKFIELTNKDYRWRVNPAPNEIYTEYEIQKMYGNGWKSWDHHRVNRDWEEVFEEEQEQKSPEQYYAGGNQINTVSISGFYNGVVFSLAGDFEQCVKLFNFIGYLDSKK